MKRVRAASVTACAIWAMCTVMVVVAALTNGRRLGELPGLVLEFASLHWKLVLFLWMVVLGAAQISGRRKQG